MKTVYIIIAFCIGLFIGYLIFPSERKINTPLSSELAETKIKLNVIDSAMFEGKIKFFEQNDSLKKKLAITNNLLSIHKSLLFSERNRVKMLTSRMTDFANMNGDSSITDSLCFEINTLNAKTDSLIGYYDSRIH